MNSLAFGSDKAAALSAVLIGCAGVVSDCASVRDAIESGAGCRVAITGPSGEVVGTLRVVEEVSRGDVKKFHTERKREYEEAHERIEGEGRGQEHEQAAHEPVPEPGRA